jgi:hypothetical protein
MKRLLVLAAAGIALACAGATDADAATIKAGWTERVDYASGRGFLRLYVRKIEVTRSTWKAWVGLTNSAPVTVRLSARLERPVADEPFTYWAGPGIWWSSYLRSSSWWPGAGTVLTHSSRAAAVRPAYPTSLGPRKSWFGTFSGATPKLPRDRLLRIGFGTLEYVEPGPTVDQNGRPLRREIVLSTTHQFTLPRRLS